MFKELLGNAVITVLRPAYFWAATSVVLIGAVILPPASFSATLDYPGHLEARYRLNDLGMLVDETAGFEAHIDTTE